MTTLAFASENQFYLEHLKNVSSLTIQSIKESLKFGSPSFSCETQTLNRGILNTVEDMEQSILERVEYDLNKMKSLKANWDGYGSSKPKSQSINIAKNFIKNFYVISKSFDPSFFLDPHVTAGADGEIVFEWWSNSDKKLTIYVTPNEISFIKVKGENTEDMEDGLLALNKAEPIQKLLQWFIF